MQFQRQAHTQQQLARARLSRVAIVLRKHALQLRRVHIVVLGRLQIRINRIAFGHGLPHFRVPHHHHVQYAHIFERKLILTQFTQTHVWLDHHLTGGLLQIATQNFHKG